MNFNRFYENLKKFGSVGRAQDGGINRLGFSKAYYESIAMVESYARSKGLETRLDGVGNLFISYNPRGSESFLLVGSHMDTVKSGGLYDGALGAIGALEVVESIKDQGLDIPIGLSAVCFSAEEGSEMGGTFGSRTLCGRNDLVDPDLKAKLALYDLALEDLEASALDPARLAGFLELHIEQGGVLEAEGKDIGIVSGIVGISRYNLILRGQANHAGTTPMDLRKDPVRDLGKVLEELYRLAQAYPQPFVMTVGDIQLRPGMYNIIPGEVEVFIEVRDMDQANIDEFFNGVEEFLKVNIKDYAMVENIRKLPVAMDNNLMGILEETSQDLGLAYKVMASGAGHDAQEMSHICPTAMVFVPSQGGLSHSPEEFTSEEDLEKGLRVLYEAVVKLLK